MSRARHQQQQSRQSSDSESLSNSDDEHLDRHLKKRNSMTKLKCGLENLFSKISRWLRCNGNLPLYLLIGSLLIGFVYVYGLTLIYQLARLLRILLQTLLPATWLKSTEEIIEEALQKYSADRLGLTDYALESSGATVLCSSDTYYLKSGLISVFNFPAWYHESSARSVIQPDVAPGKCWAMDGSHGFVTIQLVMPVVVTAVTLEHIPKEISVAGRLDSAPRDFMIVGKERGLESPDIMLGTFTYITGGNPIQLFQIKDPNCLIKEAPEKCGPNKIMISIITLKILNNYGNSEYTCIYRFRVHGNPQPSA